MKTIGDLNGSLLFFFETDSGLGAWPVVLVSCQKSIGRRLCFIYFFFLFFESDCKSIFEIKLTLPRKMPYSIIRLLCDADLIFNRLALFFFLRSRLRALLERSIVDVSIYLIILLNISWRISEKFPQLAVFFLPWNSQVETFDADKTFGSVLFSPLSDIGRMMGSLMSNVSRSNEQNNERCEST